MAEPFQKTTVIPDESAEAHASSPPPDGPGAVWTRRIIIFAFWAVVATLGLPHWIWTTSIYRSELPVDQMTKWAEGNACHLQYPIRINLESTKFPLEQVQEVAAEVQTALDRDGGKSLYSFNIATQGGHDNVSSHPALTISLHQEDASWQYRFKQISMNSTLEITYSDAKSSVGDMARPIADEVREVFQDEQAAIAYLLQGTSFGAGSKGFQLKPEMSQTIEKRTTRAFRYASEYHVTFSLFAASASPSAWDIEEAVQQYIEPLLHQLAPISKFHIDTQVQLFASFSPSIAGPQLDEASNTYKLLQSDLSGFINAAEWPLSPSIGTGPTINMVLYVPGPNQSPLLLETGGNSWTIPQWGGVQILNPNNTQADRLATTDLKPVMLTFADQLMALLGVPNSPPSLPMRISSLKRERATSLILSASSTLGALVRLTRKLESIAIPASVATSVDETISHLDQACSNLREGRYQQALENARIAEEEAEKAFFEPSMVGQVYFPDEHKVAVYVPLLGPMAVPLIMSALKELKSWRQAKKVKTS